MSLDDHRKPDGNYDGIGVMSEVSGLPRDEIRAIAEQVKANHARLAGCPWHEFERLPRPDDTVLQARLGDRYRCHHCKGEVDFHAYHWHQLGRRPMPVGEPQPVRKVDVGYPCKGGPLDGRMLAHNGPVYHVSRWAGLSDGLPSSVDKLSPMPPIETATYRLQQVGPEQLAWVFHGWPE